MNRPRRDESLEVVRHLTTVIGPRLATSLAEAQAAAYIDGRLRRAGMRVSADPFRAVVGAGPIYPLLALLGVIAALLSHWMPLPSLLLAGCGLALALSDALIAPLPILAPRRDSQNVVGTQASEKPPRWRVVLLAPLDSSPAPSGLHQLAGSRRVAVLGRSAALSLIALLTLMDFFSQSTIWWYGQIVPVTYLLLSVFPVRLLEAHASKTKPSPGGAGALAVLAAAAERLHNLRSVELWAVALGATATSNNGLENFLARYPFPRESTLLIALETIDNGHLTYASREGVLRMRPADSLLTRLAAEADAGDPDIDTEPRPYTAAPSIAALLHIRGYRAITILTQDRFMRSNSAGQSSVPVNPQILEQATRLIVGMVTRLDNEGGTTSTER